MSLIHSQKLAKTKVRKSLGYLQPGILAKEMKLIQRKERKLTVSNLILSFWKTILQGVFSYDNLASEVSTHSITKTISGQAVWKRLTIPKFNTFIKKLLEKSLKKRCDTFVESKLFTGFSNVYIQDATHYKLAKHLAKYFPGSYSKKDNTATAKVQAVFNLTKGVFADFKLCSFRDNDQKDAPRFIKKMRKGELIIRDLGYSVLTVFEKISYKEAYFLSRFKYNLTIYKVSDNQKVDLVKELRKQGSLDMWVRLGAKEKVKCRLIAVPLPEQIVNQRRRKAKENRNSKANHSKKYFELLGYGVYITNVEEGIWSPKEVMDAYRCRWYIEILFKGWKSHLKLAISLPERYMNKQRIELFFYMAFLMLTLVVMPLFTELQKRVKNKNRTVSILKLCSFVRSNMGAFISGEKCSHILKRAEHYCLYDHRKKRINAIEQIFFYQP